MIEMIERAEYTAMAEQAIEKFRTLSAIMPYNTEIVYVISREVYEAMQAYEYNFWNENTRVNVRPDGIVGVYYGARLAIINEDIADSFFMPVVYSRNFQHYNGLQVDDFVIFNDDDNDLLFRLARLTPDAMYTDTGLTVSFILTRIHDAAVTDNAAANLADNAVTIDDAIAEFKQAFEDMKETVANAQINIDLFQELAGEVGTPRRAKKRASKEKELNPGDTKLLDEYLHSFMKGGC